MPQQQTNPSDPASAPSSDFGANEWLVEEMYDQFQRDPGSVDPSWAAYFKSNGAEGTAPRETRHHPAPPPRRRPLHRRPEMAGRPAKPEQTAPGRPAAGEAKAAPQATPAPDSAAAEPAKGTTSPGAQGEGGVRSPSAAADQPTYTVLRGAPARTVANMDDSLSVPDRHLGPLGAGQAARGTTASSSTTTCPAPAAGRSRSPT